MQRAVTEIIQNPLLAEANQMMERSVQLEKELKEKTRQVEAQVAYIDKLDDDIDGFRNASNMWREKYQSLQKELDSTKSFYKRRNNEYDVFIFEMQENNKKLAEEKEAWKKQCEKYVEQIYPIYASGCPECSKPPEEVPKPTKRRRTTKKKSTGHHCLRCKGEISAYEDNDCGHCTECMNVMLKEESKKTKKDDELTDKEIKRLSKLKNTTNRKCHGCKKMKPLPPGCLLCTECVAAI